jgi:hypothetical protein
MENLISLDAKDQVSAGTLVWTNVEDGYGTLLSVTGPYILLNDWNGSTLIEEQIDNVPQLLNTETGDIEYVSYNSLLFTCYFIASQEHNKKETKNV